MTYSPLYKPLFLKDLKTYSSLKQQIEKKVKQILKDPYHNTKPLEKQGKYDLKGLRSKRVNKNFRIVFAICEECKILFPEQETLCQYCDPSLPEKTIIFFIARPRKTVYENNKPLG